MRIVFRIVKRTDRTIIGPYNRRRCPKLLCCFEIHIVCLAIFQPPVSQILILNLPCHLIYPGRNAQSTCQSHKKISLDLSSATEALHTPTGDMGMRCEFNSLSIPIFFCTRLPTIADSYDSFLHRQPALPLEKTAYTESASHCPRVD